MRTIEGKLRIWPDHSIVAIRTISPGIAVSVAGIAISLSVARIAISFSVAGIAIAGIMVAPAGTVAAMIGIVTTIAGTTIVVPRIVAGIVVAVMIGAVIVIAALCPVIVAHARLPALRRAIRTVQDCRRLGFLGPPEVAQDLAGARIYDDFAALSLAPGEDPGPAQPGARYHDFPVPLLLKLGHDAVADPVSKGRQGSQHKHSDRQDLSEFSDHASDL